MPKSGGTSFRHLLKNQYSESFLKDNDFPIHDSAEQRHRKVKLQKTCISVSAKLFSRYRNIECIHGHFLPYKYNHFYRSKNHMFVTWLRDPVDRMESHYHYWKQNHRKLDKLPLLKKFIEEDWSFEEFAFSEELRNIYSLFLWNFSIERFNFIGITEYFKEDLIFFGRQYFGISQIPVPEKNINRKKSGRETKDPGLIRELKEYHAEDYKIYNYALGRRAKRIQDFEELN